MDATRTNNGIEQDDCTTVAPGEAFGYRIGMLIGERIGAAK
jgi:hypothetical protein